MSEGKGLAHKVAELEKQLAETKKILRDVQTVLDVTYDSERQEWTLGRKWNPKRGCWQQREIRREWIDEDAEIINETAIDPQLATINARLYVLEEKVE